jgi:hypothetical protein
MPALTLDALRQAVAIVAPPRLPLFFQEIQDAFSQAGAEDTADVFCDRKDSIVLARRASAVSHGQNLQI